MRRFFVEQQRLVYSANHHGTDLVQDLDFTIGRVLEDLGTSGIEISRVTELVVAFPAEGHGAREALYLAAALEKIFPLDKLGFVFSAVVDDLPEYPSRCMPTAMINHCDWFDKLRSSQHNDNAIVLDRKFLCLNRRASAVRERLVYLLETMLPSTSIRVSLGVNSLDHYQGPGIWINTARCINGEVDQDRQHDMTDLRFRSCLFNIVSESSDQSDPRTWSTRFITEKTWKAYAMYQIPIWMAVPGLVSCVRKYGFDMFDDICDHHSYDAIDDEYERQDRVVDLAANIDAAYDLGSMQKLRRDLWPRLEHNRRLLETMSVESGREWNKALQEIW